MSSSTFLAVKRVEAEGRSFFPSYECKTPRVLTDLNTSYDNEDPSGSTQLTRGIRPMLFQCWASVEDGGPTLKQHWANASCLLGTAQSHRPDFNTIGLP